MSNEKDGRKAREHKEMKGKNHTSQGNIVTS